MTAWTTDFWRTLVPPARDRNGPLAPILVGLTVVTGLVDAFSYLTLGHVFMANMTGNVVFLAFGLAGAPGFSVWASLVALGAFAVGALTGGRLSSAARHRGQMVVFVCSLQAVLVAGATIVVSLAHTPGSGAARYVLITLLSLAMGAQNAMARKLAVPDLTTTVLTMTITGIAADSHWAGGGGSKAGRRLASALSMFVGALVGALVVLKVSQVWVTCAIVLSILAAIVVITGLLSRGEPSWVEAPSAA
jgi:uncharacterized membrane protein YoaK (UPF0700 family)